MFCLCSKWMLEYSSSIWPSYSSGLYLNTLRAGLVLRRLSCFKMFCWSSTSIDCSSFLPSVIVVFNDVFWICACSPNQVFGASEEPACERYATWSPEKFGMGIPVLQLKITRLHRCPGGTSPSRPGEEGQKLLVGGWTTCCVKWGMFRRIQFSASRVVSERSERSRWFQPWPSRTNSLTSVMGGGTSVFSRKTSVLVNNWTACLW